MTDVAAALAVWFVNRRPLMPRETSICLQKSLSTPAGVPR
jgi:hypothetical protein